MFDKATLMNDKVNKTDIRTNNEGLLVTTLINKQTGNEQNITVCKDGFSWHSAKSICRSIGYVFADWGSQPIDMQYTSK